MNSIIKYHSINTSFVSPDLLPIGANKNVINLTFYCFTIRGKLSIIQCNRKKLFQVLYCNHNMIKKIYIYLYFLVSCYHDPQNKLQHLLRNLGNPQPSAILKFVQFKTNQIISHLTFGGFLGDFLEDFYVVMNSIPPTLMENPFYLDVLFMNCYVFRQIASLVNGQTLQLFYFKFC